MAKHNDKREVVIKTPSEIRPKDVLLALFSGLLLIIIFPKFNQEVIAWFALIPLFFAIQGKRLHHCFYLGLLTGFVFFLGLVYWVSISVSRYGNLNTFLSVFVLILLVSYLSLFIGLFAFLLRYTKSRLGLKEIVSAPFIWVSLEYIRSFLFTGFPWESLGYSQYLFLPLIQISDITGVYGVSFLIVLVNALLFHISYHWFLRKEKKFYKEIFFVCLLFIITFAYGQWRMADVAGKSLSFSTVKIALLQGNIDQSRKWDPAFQRETVRIYRDLSLQAAQSVPDLIVWPEAATPFYFQFDENKKLIFDISQETGSPILFGSPAYQKGWEKTKYFNSAFLVSPESKVLGRYDKLHLVPFGEYVPLGKYLYFIEKMVEGVGDFSSGKESVLFEFPSGKFGVLICYEAIFPDLARKFVQKGSDFLLNITNDAWFGSTSAPYQHLSMVTFRAIENRVFIARSANTGISSTIDNTGRIQSETGIFSREFFVDTIKRGRIQSFYTEYGDIFAQICLVIFLSILFIREVLTKCYMIFKNGLMG